MGKVGLGFWIGLGIIAAMLVGGLVGRVVSKVA